MTRLVPASFKLVAQAIYNAMGAPQVEGANVWTVYLDLLEQIEVGIETGAIPGHIVREWCEDVVGAAAEDDEAAVEGDEQVGLFEVAGRMPEGIGHFNEGEGPFIREFSDDEEDEPLADAWMADD